MIGTTKDDGCRMRTIIEDEDESGVMFHILLALEIILTGLCHLQYDSAPPMSPLSIF
jgi:hypothetical protein